MPTSTVSPGDALDTGQKLILQGQPDRASTVLLGALQKSPDHPWLLVYSGLAQVEEGRTAPGIASIERGMDLAPTNPMLRNFYARALYDIGEYDRAAVACHRVDVCQPGHPGARTLDLLCLSHSQPVDALRALTLEAMPDSPHLQGRALHRAEEILAGELLAGNETVERQPLWGDRLPWELPPGADTSREQTGKLGTLLRDSERMKADGLPDRAIVFAEAARRQSSDDHVHASLAILYFECGRYSEAEAALRKFDVDDPGRNAYYGISLFHLGHLLDAITALERARLHEALEMPDEGLQGNALHTLGQAYLRVGQNAEARRSFIQAAAAPFGEYIAASRLAGAYLHCRAAVLSGNSAARFSSGPSPSLSLDDSPLETIQAPDAEDESDLPELPVEAP